MLKVIQNVKSDIDEQERDDFELFKAFAEKRGIKNLERNSDPYGRWDVKFSFGKMTFYAELKRRYFGVESENVKNGLILEEKKRIALQELEGNVYYINILDDAILILDVKKLDLRSCVMSSKSCKATTSGYVGVDNYKNKAVRLIPEEFFIKYDLDGNKIK